MALSASAALLCSAVTREMSAHSCIIDLQCLQRTWCCVGSVNKLLSTSSFPCTMFQAKVPTSATGSNSVEMHTSNPSALRNTVIIQSLYSPCLRPQQRLVALLSVISASGKHVCISIKFSKSHADWEAVSSHAETPSTVLELAMTSTISPQLPVTHQNAM